MTREKFVVIMQMNPIKKSKHSDIKRCPTWKEREEEEKKMYIGNNQKTVNKNTIKRNIYTKKINYLYLDGVQLYIWLSRYKMLSLLLTVIEIYYYLLHQI